MGIVNHMGLKIEWNLRKNVIHCFHPLLNYNCIHERTKNLDLFLSMFFLKRKVISSLLMVLFHVKFVNCWYCWYDYRVISIISQIRAGFSLFSPFILDEVLWWKGRDTWFSTLLFSSDLFFSPHTTFPFFNCQWWKNFITSLNGKWLILVSH